LLGGLAEEILYQTPRMPGCRLLHGWPSESDTAALEDIMTKSGAKGNRQNHARQADLPKQVSL